MSTSFESTDRFLRPTDVGRVRRNQNRIQVQRFAVVARSLILLALCIGAVLWAYRQTQSDARFAVKSIEITGAVHTPRASIDAITRTYVGLNLFKIDIARVQRDLGSLPWVSRIDIEKKLPDTLRININERAPLALVQVGDRLGYVDDRGVVFAELSPSVGDQDLPVITNAAGDELVRSVALVRELRAKDPVLYSRVSEIRPIAPRGFSLFDRELGAFVYANADDLSAKWRNLYSIAQAEHLGRSQIEYADLRFGDRIVIKPVHAIAALTAVASPKAPLTQITN